MKIAAIYKGRSISQPVLLNQLNNKSNISLEFFSKKGQDSSRINFDHNVYKKDAYDLKIRGTQPLWLNQFLIRKQWERYLKRELTRETDVVITMNELGPPSVEIAKAYGIPTLFFIRSLGGSGQVMYDPEKSHITNFTQADFGGKIQYPFLVKNFNAYKSGMEDATQVIANSNFVSNRLKDDFGVDSKIVYPPIQIEEYEVEYDETGYIGMINPRNKSKGGDIFMEIVEEMSSEEFLTTGAFRLRELERRARSLDNLRYMGWCEDMREFYSRIRLLLVPSRGAEAFGRVAAEAMVSGIPCVVSDRGGLPEVVGDTGYIVENIECTDAWVDAIHDALHDHNPEAQRQRTERFSAEKQGEKLYEIVESVL